MNTSNWFLRTKMWLSYIVSAVEKDRGRVPDNIGNRILVTNNLIVTKKGLTSYIFVEELSIETPVCLISDLTTVLRERGSNAIVDCVFKNEPYTVHLTDSGLKSRIAMWEKVINDEDARDIDKARAARCLYTVGIARSGEHLMKSRIFLAVHEETASKLTEAERIIYDYLTSIEAIATPVARDLVDVLKYVTIASGRRSKNIKNFRTVVTSPRTLAQMLPNSGSINDETGLYMGCNLDNYQPFRVDFEHISTGRNLYVLSSTGGGKTWWVINFCESAREAGWAVCIQDIKGNEFNSFIEATNGYVVSLRQLEPGYINSFIMHAEEATDETAEVYFKERIAFSKRQLTILSALTTSEEKADLDELLDEFFTSVYIKLGVLASNTATWVKTEELTPFRLFDMFKAYMTPTMIKKYERIARKVLSEFRMYFTKEGSKSYIFTKEFGYYDILKAPTLMFDFGLLDNAGQSVDPVLFKLKFEYMLKLNADFVAYKFKQGIKVLKVLEEAQIAVQDDDIIRGYVKEYTLGRAQGQTTVMIGNSISAFLENPVAAPLIENVKGLVLGSLNDSAKAAVAKAFDLEDVIDQVDIIGTSKEFENAFLFVNMMQPRAVTPLLKVHYRDGVSYKICEPKVHI